MDNKIKELENAAKLLNLSYEIISGEKAHIFVEKVYELYHPLTTKNHLSIGSNVSLKLNTDENEFTFSIKYFSNNSIFLFFEQDEMNKNLIFVLKNGKNLSEILKECYGMEYFISNEKFEFLVSVNWYTIEIVKLTDYER